MALERVANAISDTAWSLPADQTPPTPAELAQLAGALHAMAEAVAQGAPVAVDVIDAPVPALHEAAAAIESLRATLAGPEFATTPGKPAPSSSNVHQL